MIIVHTRAAILLLLLFTALPGILHPVLIIANDVAKYFAIIPAAFAATCPALAELNIMHLGTPESATLSSAIFNTLIIAAMTPLALRGIRYRPLSAVSLLRRHLVIYGGRRVYAPFCGDKGD
jgi:K+-transporting ATPase ATPase B chain